MVERDRPVSPAEDDPPLSEEERQARLCEAEAELAQIQTELDAELKREPTGKIVWRSREMLFGILLVVMTFGLYSLGFSFGLQLNDWAMHRHPLTPGGDPPLYFIREDFLSGLALILPLLLVLAMAGAYFRRSPFVAFMITWQALLFMGPKIAASAVIAWNCTGLFGPAIRAPAWPNFKSYMSDPVFFWTHALVFTAALLISLLPLSLKWARARGYPLPSLARLLIRP
ncbi:MAG: hypothetical protein AAGK14_14155 [Verrucomicrobiota bacterium]